MSELRLRFDIHEIPHWAARYPQADDAWVEIKIAPQMRARGYYTHGDLLAVCEWKSPRIRPPLPPHCRLINSQSETCPERSEGSLQLSTFNFELPASW